MQFPQLSNAKMALRTILVYRVVPGYRATTTLRRRLIHVTTNFVLKVNYLIGINLVFIYAYERCTASLVRGI